MCELKVLHPSVVQVHYSCLFTNMKQKYLLTASVFYLWLLIVSSPSTNYPASSLMTHLIYFRDAAVKEDKCPLLLLSQSAVKFSPVSQEKTQSTSNKTKRGPTCSEVANSVLRHLIIFALLLCFSLENSFFLRSLAIEVTTWKLSWDTLHLCVKTSQ